MAVFFARSTGNALVPNSRAAALVMERLPRNTPIRVEAKVPRDVGAAQPLGIVLRQGAKLDMACRQLEPLHDARAKSISFAAMGGDDFGRFMDAAFAYVRDTLCVWIEGSPHWADIQTILRESHMLGEDAA